MAEDDCNYFCVHCLQPSASLYRILGKDVIKLSPCSNCLSPAVDPYCEREWLLVVLDLVLLRTTAYRHVLWNRGSLLAQVEQQKHQRNSSSIEAVRHNVLYDNIPRFLLTACLLRAHIGMVSTQDRVDAEHTWEAAAGFVQLTLISVTGYAVQIGSIMLLLNFPGNKQRSMLNVLVLAVLLPAVAAQIVTALALLWENSDTVRAVGSLLALIHQWMAVLTVSEISIQQQNRQVLLLITGLVFALSILLRALVMMVLGKSVAADSIVPCPGLGVRHAYTFGGFLCFG